MQKRMKQKIGDIVFGMHPIIELLRAKRRKLLTIYTTKPTPKLWPSLERLLPRSINIQYVNREVLHKLAGTSDHQGVVAYAQPFIIRKSFFNTKKQPFLLMLDGIQDPRNLGAILRSAYCTGVDGVIITEKQAAPISATVLKASAGLAEHLDIYLASSASAAVHELKHAGYCLYLTTFNGENASTYSYSKPLCVVIGNEAVGITKSIIKHGIQITLPQRTSHISYNASVAAGIVLFIIAIQCGKI